MANQAMAGNSSAIVCGDGGSERLTLSAAGVATGADQPCRLVDIIATTGTTASRVDIGTACTATTGIPIPIQGTDFYRLCLEVANTNQLNFFGTAADTVDILWRK